MSLEHKLYRFSRLAALGATVLGAITLLGWKTDIVFLHNPLQIGTPMSLNTAFCCTVYGVALGLLGRTGPGNGLRLGRGLAGLMLLFTLAAWLELATGTNLGINGLLYGNGQGLPANLPRMPVPLNSIVPFVLIGAGLLTLNSRRPAWSGLSIWLGLAVLGIALLSLVGTGLAWAGIGGPPKLALTSSVVLALLGGGLAGAQDNPGFLQLFAPTHPHRAIVRRVLLLGLLVPLVLYVVESCLFLTGAAALQDKIILLTVAAGTGLLGALVYFLRWLQRIDEQRQTAEQTRDVLLARVQQQAATLQYEVAERTQELHTLHARMQFAISSAGFGLWEYDFQTQRLTWDDRTLELYGLTRVGFTNHLDDWRRALHPADLPAAEKATADVLAGGTGHYEAQFRILRPDGTTRYIHAIGYLQRNPEGGMLRMVGLDKDVTRDREHELELAALNERLQLALRAERAGVWDYDVASGRQKWDRRQCEIYGVSPDTFDHHFEGWRRLVHPEDRARAERVGEHNLTAGDYVVHNFRIIRPDGGVRHIHSVGYVHRNAAGQLERIVGLDRDITEEMEMRDKLRVAEERLELALQASGEGMWDWDVPSGQVYYSPRWMEMLGYRFDELPHTVATWENLLHPDDKDAALAAMQDHFQGRSSVYYSEHRLRSKAGSWIWTLSRGEVVSRDARGGPVRVVGMQGDITERKLLEQQLRRSQEISLQVGRLAQIGAWEVDVGRRTITWDPEVYRIHGVELGFRPDFDTATAFYPPEVRPVLLNALQQAERDGTPFDLELPFVTAQQRRLWVRVIGRAELSAGRVVRLFGALQDITTRYEAEESRHRLETQLFQAQKMETLGTLAGGIAHDFNNLLTGIMGYQDLALDALTPDHPAHHCIVAARDASVRAGGLVEQILSFSRPAADAEPMSLDLTLVIEEARRFLRATVPATIQIESEVLPGCGRVQADATQMHQVLLNLGSNAAHAMRQGGGVMRITLAPVSLTGSEAAALGGLTAGPHVQLSVEDTGHGIDPETLKRIFDPFFTTKSVGEGTGLGLSVVHGIVRAHHGAIQVRSALGEGSRFSIYLPVADTETSDGTLAAAPLSRGQGEMIFIVDDEELVAGFAKMALERFGYRARCFALPDQCLEAVQQDPAGCAVLITDQTMPSMTGMELAARTRALAAQLPIIVMSGYFSKISSTALEQLGHIALLAKPFTSEEINHAVHRALHPEA